jgi:hypothetical protein
MGAEHISRPGDTLVKLPINMLVRVRLPTLLALTFIPSTVISKGPVTSLNIVNKVIAPDGYPRS